MSISQLSGLRRNAGRLASLLFILAALALVDGFAAEMRGEFGRIEAVAGQTLAINGPMPPGAQAVHDLRAATDAPDEALRLTPTETYAGFWYGGMMWKGELAVAQGTAPGRYSLAVRGPGPEPVNPALAFTVAVYPDLAAMRREAGSMSLRHLGIRPFPLAGMLAGLALVASLAAFAVAVKLTKALSAQGIVEIYMCKKDADGTLLGFDAPPGFEAPVGTTVTLLDPAGCEAGLAVITRNDDKGVVALAPPEVEARHGFSVKL